MTATFPKTNKQVIVLSGPSGVGKTTLAKAIDEKHPQITKVITHTTRTQRKGEQHKKNYFFVSAKEFAQMVKLGDFIEHARVFDYHYGSSFNQLKHIWQQGHTPLLEIDWQGALAVQDYFKNNLIEGEGCEVLTIFLKPPSLNDLKVRLIERGRDDEEVMKRRLAQVELDLSYAERYDLVVVNQDFDKAYTKIFNWLEKKIKPN